MAEAGAPVAGGASGPDGAAPPARRAPYADNPAVGARGLRTQQRILDAALAVFGESGYDRASLDRIGQLAGCSRVAIYQYFAGKDDVFRHLAGQVARQLRASMEALDPVTADEAGVAALRAWVARYAEVHRRYEPVFRAFEAAAASDAALLGGAASTAERNTGTFLARLAPTGLPPRQLDPLVVLLLAGVNQALGLGAILRGAAPAAYPPERVEQAIAEVVHRALFGVLPGVNARPPAGDPPPVLAMSPTLRGAFDRVAALQREAAEPGRRALASLLDAGDAVVTSRGYLGVRVDEVAAAAGVSRGAFYRYFRNIDEFVRVVAVRAVAEVSAALGELPDAGDRAALRRWLRRYHAVHAAKGAMIRVWVEAVEDALAGDRAAVFDWGRRRMVRLLAGRTFGDVEVDAVVLLAVVEAFGAGDRGEADVEAALRAVERGFLG